jgi:hypothetical protein
VDDIFIIEYIVSQESQVAEGCGVTRLAQGGEQSPLSGGVGHGPYQNSSVGSREGHDANHDASLPVRVRRLDDIVVDLDMSDLQLHAVSSDGPTSLAEAQADQNWQKAMEDEMDPKGPEKTIIGG